MDQISHKPNVHAIAREMKSAQDEARQIEPFTSRLRGFDVPTAYEVAHIITTLGSKRERCQWGERSASPTPRC